MMHKDLALELLNRIKNDLVDCAEVEREPVSVGKIFIMGLVPKKSSK